MQTALLPEGPLSTSEPQQACRVNKMVSDLKETRKHEEEDQLGSL